jgi:hypothetical protein
VDETAVARNRQALHEQRRRCEQELDALRPEDNESRATRVDRRYWLSKLQEVEEAIELASAQWRIGSVVEVPRIRRRISSPVMQPTAPVSREEAPQPTAPVRRMFTFSLTQSAADSDLVLGWFIWRLRRRNADGSDRQRDMLREILRAALATEGILPINYASAEAREAQDELRRRGHPPWADR